MGEPELLSIVDAVRAEIKSENLLSALSQLDELESAIKEGNYAKV